MSSAERRITTIMRHLQPNEVSSSEGPVLFVEHKNGVKQIILNRPRALNALTIDMLNMIRAALQRWETDKSTTCVVFTGAGDRAFCAGGDLKELLSTKGGGQFVGPEYKLDYYISTYRKPTIAIWNGITMGGGVGISIHCTFRIATNRTAFAMPEAKIGFFPDVAASYFLNNCPGEIGMYLALTGDTISGEDAFYSGLATHFVSKDNISNLLNALFSSPFTSDLPIKQQLSKILSAYACVPSSSRLLVLQPIIDMHFSKDSVEAILASLQKDSSEFAVQTYKRIRANGPLAVKVAFEQMRRARSMSLKEIYQMEFRLAIKLLSRSDMREGVQAALVDKNHSPKWDPPIVEAVSADQSTRYCKRKLTILHAPGSQRNNETTTCYLSELHNNSTIKLDVGGTYFTTTLSTLKAEPDSMLAAMFSGRYAIQLDENSRIFIDRDGRHFHHILNWLRNKRVPSGLSLEVIESLLIEAEYYSLRDFYEALLAKKREVLSAANYMLAETKVITIVNSWSSFPGINIETAQQRIQNTIDEYEKEGWVFVSSTTETCKSRLESNASTHVNLMHLFFKKLK